MHTILASFLVFFAGWTLSTQLCVIFGWSLKILLFFSPFIVTILFLLYFLLPKIPLLNLLNPPIVANKSNNTHQLTVLILLFLPVSLYYSWLIFWILSVFILGYCILNGDHEIKLTQFFGEIYAKKTESLIIILLTMAIIIIAYAISRSDLDDAYYLAIAAHSSSHPQLPLLSMDPMLGEVDFPLVLPSLRFTSFEVLSGALAYVLSVPAMDVYYIYLLPLWVTLTLIAVFLLTKELLPKHWLFAGIMTIIFILLFGEMHRGPANFSFVRLFQGKAAFLSIIVPTLYYLNARFFSKRGTNSDLFLLVCCQISAIGLSQFGMLAAPMAGFSALISNLPLALTGERKKLYSAFATLLIPLPYLIDVALQFKGSPIMKSEIESAENVWRSVFGNHQQYLIAILLLAGPVLAKDIITKWRLAVPPFLLFAVYLNPLASNFISRYITTPPVYWRVIWSFPILVFSAVSFCMITAAISEQKLFRINLTLLAIMVLALTIIALPYNTLRFENIGPFSGFATWKIPSAYLDIAQKAMKVNSSHGRLLAPDEIAGVISRFERHPKLVTTRGAYLDLLRPAIGENKDRPRRTLYDFITQKSGYDDRSVRSALRILDVSVIVMHSKNENPRVIRSLRTAGYQRQEKNNGYSIWKSLSH